MVGIRRIKQVCVATFSRNRQQTRRLALPCCTVTDKLTFA